MPGWTPLWIYFDRGCVDDRFRTISSVGDASAYGGIVVPPVVDSSNGLVYAVAGTNWHNSQRSCRFPISNFNNSGVGKREAALGIPRAENLSIPAFNTAYFSSVTSIELGDTLLRVRFNGQSLTLLYDVGFNSIPPVEYWDAPDCESIPACLGRGGVLSPDRVHKRRTRSAVFAHRLALPGPLRRNFEQL